jgi:uncharacterized protein (TIGR00661 family)
MAKFIFIVQGEGKGHLTQAIAMKEILQTANHQIVATMVGIAKNRKIPEFYTENITAPLYTFESPSLKYGNSKSPSLLSTIFGQMVKAKKYLSNVDRVHEVVKEHKPDAIINFYEMLGGFYNLFYKPNIPTICVGHQYLLLHTQFKSISGRWLDRWLLNFNTNVTAIGASKKLALSFNQIPNDSKNSIVVMPPLLRNMVKDFFIEDGDFLLAYVTHHKIIEYITDWQSNNKHIKIHCFIDKKNMVDGQEIQKNLFFHKVDANNFLEMMGKCKGLVSTAGFESVCEAMYMGKPVMMVPVRNHIEQKINAFDGQRAGAGLASKKFKLNKFIKFLPDYKDISAEFQEWENKAEEMFIQNIEHVLIEFQQKTRANSTKTNQQKYTIKSLLSGYFGRKWQALSPY